MYKKVSIIVFVLVILTILTSCTDTKTKTKTKTTTTAKSDSKQNIFISEISDFNNLKPEDKNNFDCSNLNDNKSKQYCNNNKIKLKTDEFVYNTDINKSIKWCWNFIKNNKDIFDNESTCRLTIVLSRYFFQLSNKNIFLINEKPISCDILKTYWEDFLCKDALIDIQKYIEYEKSKKIFNKYKDILPTDLLNN